MFSFGYYGLQCQRLVAANANKCSIAKERQWKCLETALKLQNVCCLKK